ncbi:unnamed protein product [Cylindrotheca closterium]|uniref:Endonuclease/exonuclease/phosphatase domain-containing protein n=1 Tax=Cylindrotheca closterium TaxID=2856 RepID=A0AAD2CLN1_9STRA|nr:unnamed protein product [Cylindrotheca closterium]
MTHEKQKGLFKCWTDQRVGIALLAEINLQWSAMPRGHKWFDLVKFFTNQGQCLSSGVSNSASMVRMFCYITQQGRTPCKSGGKDETGLGRFSWIKIWSRGIRQQDGPLDLVVVSAYCPNKEGTNVGSVWNYQRNYWLSNGVTMDPCDKITLDLVDLIKQLKAEGCEDVSNNSPFSCRQEMWSEGLTKAILRQHQGPYPATTQSRTMDTPIDGIFVTDGVRVMAGGYLDFQQYFKSDHRGLWIDIDLEATLGAPPVTSPSFQPGRLTLADGRSVDRYIKAAEAGYRHFRLSQRLTQLSEDILVQDGYLTANQQARFNTIHRQAYEIRRRAERNCRKLVRTSSRKVWRLLKKNGLSDAWKLSEADLEAKWYLEHQDYTEVKQKRAHQWRLEYLENESAADQKAKKSNIKARTRRT